MFYRFAKSSEVFIHLFTDGRDSPPISALSYLDLLLAFLQPHENIRPLWADFTPWIERKNGHERKGI